jgi:oligosaccharide repeat unit polymerase
MTPASALILAIFALANRYVGKSFLYPPAFYSAWWSFLLFVLVICGDTFYPLSLKTLSMFVVGAGAFSIGGLAHTLFTRPAQASSSSVSSQQQKFALVIIYLGLLSLLVAFPFYLQRLQELSAASTFTDFWRGVRQQTTSGNVGEYGLGAYEYLLVFASFLSLLAVFHNDGSRKGLARAIAIITVTLVYTFLTASRLAAMTTIFAIIALSWLRSSKPGWRLLFVCAILFAIVFAAPAILLEKGGGLGLTFTENASGVVESLQVYTVGGLVAFDQVIDDVSLFPEWLSFRFFWAVANAAGFHVDVPVLILPFTGTPTPTNVYTIYGSYFADFGWGGTLSLMFVLGASLAWLYGHAKRGQPEAVILYALAISRLMMTAATDGFLVSLSFWLQLTLFTLLVYRWPRLTERKATSAPEKVVETMTASVLALER